LVFFPPLDVTAFAAFISLFVCIAIDAAPSQPGNIVQAMFYL
jgi:hypothetical protein